MSETIDKLLTLKVSSNLVVRQSASGKYEIDIDAITSLGQQVNKLSENTGVIIVTSYARKLLEDAGSGGGRKIVDTWGAAIERETQSYQVSEMCDEIKDTRRIFNYVKAGGVAIVNANHYHLDAFSRFHNNDYVAADLVRQASSSALFDEGIELGLLTNVSGVLRDVEDKTSVISTLHAVNIRSLECQDLEWYEWVMGRSGEPMTVAGTGSTGGMATKLHAALAVVSQAADTRVWIADARTDDVIERAMSSEVGTSIVGHGKESLDSSEVVWI